MWQVLGTPNEETWPTMADLPEYRGDFPQHDPARDTHTPHTLHARAHTHTRTHTRARARAHTHARRRALHMAARCLCTIAPSSAQTYHVLTHVVFTV